MRLLLVLGLAAYTMAFVPRVIHHFPRVRHMGWFDRDSGDGEDFKEADVKSKEIDRLLAKIEATQNEINSTISQREKDEVTLKELDSEFGEEIARVKKEFARMKERSYEEAQTETKDAKAKALIDVLPITDNFFRAKPLFEPQETKNEKAIMDAYDEVFEMFQSVLSDFGVTKVESLGQPFDFNTMEAIMTSPSADFEKDVVCTEYQVGYMMEDRCIRPAMVVVSTGI